LPAPGQARHYRADWNIGDLRDIAIVQLIDFPQDNHFAKLRRQLCQGALNLFGIYLEKCDLLGILDSRPCKPSCSSFCCSAGLRSSVKATAFDLFFRSQL
jgi:hypothetical protein